MPGRRSIHTPKWDRCVKAVRISARRYHRKVNAYAVCSARLGEQGSVKKGHRRK